MRDLPGVLDQGGLFGHGGGDFEGEAFGLGGWGLVKRDERGLRGNAFF